MKRDIREFIKSDSAETKRVKVEYLSDPKKGVRLYCERSGQGWVLQIRTPEPEHTGKVYEQYSSVRLGRAEMGELAEMIRDNLSDGIIPHTPDRKISIRATHSSFCLPDSLRIGSISTETNDEITVEVMELAEGEEAPKLLEKYEDCSYRQALNIRFYWEAHYRGEGCQVSVEGFGF